MLLIIDNYDSFVHNVARYLRCLGQTTRVVRNDMITVRAIRQAPPDAIIFSPGPCSPTEAGASLEIVRQLHGIIPMLGICLGHQTIAAAFGADVVRAPEVVHGRSSRITHCGTGLFAGIPQPLSVGRYHSLTVLRETVPAEFAVTAETEDGQVMAIAHREMPIFGLQFHPESILTESGSTLLANFLNLAGAASIPIARRRPEELRPSKRACYSPPNAPVTF